MSDREMQEMELEMLQQQEIKVLEWEVKVCEKLASRLRERIVQLEPFYRLRNEQANGENDDRAG